jgi:DNA primase
VDYLFDRFEKDFDLHSAVGKRGYADRLVPNLRRLGDPVEREHYIKLLAEKTDTSSEAVASKIAKEESEAETGNNKKTGVSGDQPARRAVVQADGRPTARRLLEESLLSLTLIDSITRLSLEDLEAHDFTSPERQTIFTALSADRETTGIEMAKSLTEAADYVKILLLRGEQEFAELAPADRSFQAFGLARRLQMASNKDVKKILSGKLREAERDGDVQLVGRLLQEYQKLLDEEV